MPTTDISKESEVEGDQSMLIQDTKVYVEEALY